MTSGLNVLEEVDEAGDGARDRRCILGRLIVRASRSTNSELVKRGETS